MSDISINFRKRRIKVNTIGSLIFLLFITQLSYIFSLFVSYKWPGSNMIKKYDFVYFISSAVLSNIMCKPLFSDYAIFYQKGGFKMKEREILGVIALAVLQGMIVFLQETIKKKT